MANFNISDRDIEAQFLEFLRDNECEPDGEFSLVMDGAVHRYRVQGDKHGDKSGAYCVYPDNWPAGWCQNWRNGAAISWSFDRGSLKNPISDEEYKAALARAKASQEAIQKQQEAGYMKAANECRNLCEQLPEAPYVSEHAYAVKKHIYSYGLRYQKDGDFLVVPLRNIEGEIVSMQSINPDGRKFFKLGSRTSGAFFSIALDNVSDTVEGKKQPILLGEGVATMSTIYELTKLPCVAAMNCGNIRKVAEALRGKYSNPIIIMADNDHGKKVNAGKEAAEKANRELKLDGVVMPDFAENEDGTDWNDFYRLHDYNEDFCSNAIREKIKQLPLYNPQHGEQADKGEQEIKTISDAEYLDAFFERDMKEFQKYSQRKTGFSNLDERLTIYPAFYVIGAISSLGKTTFNLQLADNLAGRGEHVLYFSFEQSRFELVSKSLSRLCQPEGAIYESSPTAIEIRKGRITPELRGAMQKFKEISQHKQIVECNFETTASTIIDTINAYIQQFGVKPVVFIDYLQLVRSSNSKLTNTKDIVDDVVRALKKYQMQNELTMFVISSLNRQNYLTVIDFESFKETGGIEYTADCVMGLQLAVMDTGLFETDTKTGKKRKVVKAAKKATPRQIELCILKNRYGISNESFYFQYYPKFDLFLPSTKDIAKEAAEKLVASIPDDDGPRKKPK